MIFNLFTSLVASLAISAVSASAEGPGDASSAGAHLLYAYNGILGFNFFGKRKIVTIKAKRDITLMDKRRLLR